MSSRLVFSSGTNVSIDFYAQNGQILVSKLPLKFERFDRFYSIKTHSNGLNESLKMSFYWAKSVQPLRFYVNFKGKIFEFFHYIIMWLSLGKSIYKPGKSWDKFMNSCYDISSIKNRSKLQPAHIISFCKKATSYIK